MRPNTGEKMPADMHDGTVDHRYPRCDSADLQKEENGPRVNAEEISQ